MRGIPWRNLPAAVRRWLRPARWKPARRARRSAAPDTTAAAGILRVLRTTALGLIGILITAAALVSLMESYRGLYEWAVHHQLSGIWAALFPVQVDVFIVVGELVLFVAMVDTWCWRDRIGAWTVALAGLAVSTAGNIGHVPSADLQSRGTAAVPPVAAFFLLWLGLGVIKRIPRPAAPSPRPQPAVGSPATAGKRKTKVTAEDVTSRFKDKIDARELPSQADIRREWRVGSDLAKSLVEEVSAATGLPLPSSNGARP